MKEKRKVTITPLIEKRAHVFHELHGKGYSVKEIASEIGIHWRTLYRELQAYAEVMGVPSKEKPDRLYYIKEYKDKTTGVRIVKGKTAISKTGKQTKSVKESPKTENINPAEEKRPTNEIESKKVDKVFEFGFDLNTIGDCFDTIDNYAEYLLGIIDNIVSKHTKIVNSFKEEET